jgi:Domain of unknown function (4846)
MSLPAAILALLPTPLSDRLEPPSGFTRVHVEQASFGAWLREMPVKPGVPPVRLYDRTLKRSQSAQWLVLDIDVGTRDLQQCADAVMRLYAEWQWASEQKQQICFRFTSGHAVPWWKWSQGYRPRVRGQDVTLVQRAASDDTYAAFRRYLDSVFAYAGTHSLKRALVPVRDPLAIQPGDVFIQGGFPGHAVVVVDVVENPRGERRFALAQSFMPAQDIHVLRNPSATGPWYAARASGALRTPEWTFEWTDLMRFRETACP